MQDRYPDFREVFFALCKQADTPVSLGAWIRFNHGSYRDLVEMSINPGDYTNSDAFQRDYLVTSFVSKYTGLDTGIDLEAVALSKFATSEVHCRNTNRIIKRCLIDGFPPSLCPVIHGAQEKIKRLLGVCSSFKTEEGVDWGPGATTDLKKSEAFLDTKISLFPLPVSRRALPLAANVVSRDNLWKSLRPEDTAAFVIEENCRVITVPKNAKGNRTIAIEPRMNLFLQKGVGTYFRNRLKTVGVDLNDQGTNQRLASLAGSRFLATLDLKAASDSISKELIYLLLPIEWALYLDDLRSHRYSSPSGQTYSFEKFSSMGNGFTFELESLIFWALASSLTSGPVTVGHDFAVYGDDVILPAEYASEFTNSLRFLGFELNPDKSFSSGLFYESCGKHYFDGLDVTPVYQKEVLDSRLSYIRAHNRLFRAAMRGQHCFQAVKTFTRTRDYELFKLPPHALEDDGYLTFCMGSPPCWNMGFRCRVLREGLVSFPSNELAIYSHRLRHMSFGRRFAEGHPFLGDVYRKSVVTRVTYRWVQNWPTV